jgi:hypothetical protein
MGTWFETKNIGEKEKMEYPNHITQQLSKDFIQNQKVFYDTQNIKGIGQIKGIHKEHPIFGQTYIIEDLSNNLPNKTYKFTNFLCSAIFLKEIEE